MDNREEENEHGGTINDEPQDNDELEVCYGYYDEPGTIEGGQGLVKGVSWLMSISFLFDGPEDARWTLLLAHGAGAPMDSQSMNVAAKALGEAGCRVARFEFGYMAGRRSEGSRKPPPKAETLIPEYLGAVAELLPRAPLIIGGKSMGGRVASMIADDLHASGQVAGLLCLGYPFHPPGKSQQLRTKHLETLRVPALFVQGTRDEFGSREEVTEYELSSQIDLLWLEDGDHDLKPRKLVSGFTAADHLTTMARVATDWMRTRLDAGH